jgi:hypothetical protein
MKWDSLFFKRLHRILVFGITEFRIMNRNESPWVFAQVVKGCVGGVCLASYSYILCGEGKKKTKKIKE